MTDRALTIRTAVIEDAPALHRLAQLDSARPLRGRVLLAEADGSPIAAVALETGLVTADPFQHTAEAVRMLMLRRYPMRVWVLSTFQVPVGIPIRLRALVVRRSPLVTSAGFRGSAGMTHPDGGT